MDQTIRNRRSAPRRLSCCSSRVSHFAKLSGFDERLAGKLERFEAFEGVRQRIAADHDAVIFQNHTVAPILKGVGDVLTQLFAARTGIGANPTLPQTE